ncbi:hypothetical protein [Streptomyces californicus]|uniref:hypothetical protein n=1 Tax=Streptomyces californicus TaxID=67351 RepID=UPI0033E05C8A
MTQADLADQVNLAVRAHVSPAPRFPEAVWVGDEVRVRLWADQAAAVARVLGLGGGLPLGMELAAIGVRVSLAAEVHGVETVQMSKEHALRFAALLEDADRARHSSRWDRTPRALGS